MKSGASASGACWPLRQWVHFLAHRGVARSPLSSVRMHPSGPGSYAPVPKINSDHDGASTSPGLAVVSSAAVTSPALRSGARYGLSRRIGRRLFFFSSGSSAGVARRKCVVRCWSEKWGVVQPAMPAALRAEGRSSRYFASNVSLPRHTHYHHRSDSAEALPFVVAHRRCSSFAAHRHLSAKTRRCASESRPKPAPLCSSTRTSQGRRRECATTSREFTTKRRAQFVPGRP